MLTSTRFDAVTSVLGVQQLVTLDQEPARIGGAAHRRVVEDHIAPAMLREQPIYCGEIDTGLVVGFGAGGGCDVHDHSPQLCSWRCNARLAARANHARLSQPRAPCCQ
jgi:hypothetical protein